MARYAIPILLLTGCSSGLSFPSSFLFGVATAGFQNEMGCPTIDAGECDDPNSDWYQWITNDTIRAEANEYIVGGPPSTGPGWFELYPQDLQLAKDGLHVKAVRLSIEWSRVFPTTTVGVTGYDNLKAIASPTALSFYHAVLAQIRADGMTPLVTINHYTLPLWMHDGLACNQDIQTCMPDGWLSSNTVTEIAKYAGFLGQEFGSQVDLWATLNEPLAVPLSGYIYPSASRSNPPGVLLDGSGAQTVILNEIKAHAAMYEAVKQADTVAADGSGDPAQVGLVYNMGPFVPADPTNQLDQIAAKNGFYLYDEVFLNAVILGQLDSNFTGASTATSHPELAHMDYLGINYYNEIVVAGTQTSLLPSFSPLLTIDLLSSQTNLTALFPEGIYQMIKFVQSTYKVPIYITENGTSQGADAPSAPHDCVQYLEWVQKAIAEGSDVRGYFYWTLTDNYEWNHGMTSHYGLYAVDSTNPQKPRTIRPLGQTYAQIAQAHAIPSELAKEYPITPDAGIEELDASVGPDE